MNTTRTDTHAVYREIQKLANDIGISFDVDCDALCIRKETSSVSAPLWVHLANLRESLWRPELAAQVALGEFLAGDLYEQSSFAAAA